MDSSRYKRQIASLGPDSQEKLANSKILIVGCGGLGCVLADAMVRSGIGLVRICDDDEVQLDNIHRQILYNETDVGKRKTDAAKERLRSINSEIEIDVRNVRFSADNAEDLLNSIDLVLDGIDSIKSRILINEACKSRNIPWVYGGVSDQSGICIPVAEVVRKCPGILLTSTQRPVFLW